MDSPLKAKVQPRPYFIFHAQTERKVCRKHVVGVCLYVCCAKSEEYERSEALGSSVLTARAVRPEVVFISYSGRKSGLLLFTASSGMAASFLLLYPLSGFMRAVLALCFFWGIVYTLFNLSPQVKIMAVLPQASTISMTIYSAVFNLGIGCGTTIGGAVCIHASIAYIGYAGGSLL